MDRRIKTVYAVSIVTMLLILFGQGYWLYNQYQYSADMVMEEMKQLCSQLIAEEWNVRKELYSESREGEAAQDTIEIKIGANLQREGVGRTSSSSVFTYNFPDGRQIKIDAQYLNSSDASEIYNRYVVSRFEPFRRQTIDSLLMAKGYGKTSGFKRLEGMELALEPQYSSVGGWQKALQVTYCSNPMLGEGVTFTVPVPVHSVLRLMAWQLFAGLLLFYVIAFCLCYQIKTIVIQRRIDGIRHEFMKNMILEQKQLQEEANADDCIKVGDTEFRYGLNELRHANERVILTSRQAEIFRLLAAMPNEVVSREKILAEAWGDDSYSNSLALNVQITYLRRAIKSDARLSIDVVYKKGYVLNVR